MSKYHNTAPFKFVILSVATLGFYELYWCYKCWSYIKDEDRESIRPFWRAFFAPIWTYALFKEVYKGGKTSLGVAVFVSYFMLQALWKLPDPYWLLSFLTIIPLLPVVIKVNQINKNEDGPRSPTYWRFGWKHWLISLLGIPVFAFSVFSSLNIMPSTQVISGELLSGDNMSFFKEIDACRDGEEIYYFYSAGIFSIKENGNFFTNRRVVSYWESPEDESYYLESATYEEIENIQINYTSSFLEDTEIIISKVDGNEFSLYISGEGQRDKIFVKKLMKYWRAQQGGI